VAVSQVLDRWNDYFLDVWIRVDNDQKSCLTTLASLDGCNRLYIEQQTGLDDQTVRRTLQNLLKRDLICAVEDGNYRIAVPIFREWMKQNNDLSEPDFHDLPRNHIHDLPVNADFASSDAFEITIIPSTLHTNVSKLERNIEKSAAFEQENQPSRLRSAVQSSFVRSAPRPTRLLLISLILLFIIASSVLIVPAVLNRFAHRPSIASTTDSTPSSTASVIGRLGTPNISGFCRRLGAVFVRNGNSAFNLVCYQRINRPTDRSGYEQSLQLVVPQPQPACGSYSC
jgi:hypothetical protein